MKRAVAYKIDNKIVIMPSNLTVSGYGLHSKPYIMADISEPYSEIGEKLQKGFSEYREGVPDAPMNHRSSLWKDIGEKSNKSFMQKAVLGKAYIDDENKIHYLSTKKVLSRGSFRTVLESEKIFAYPMTYEEMGKELVDSLNKCE